MILCSSIQAFSSIPFQSGQSNGFSKKSATEVDITDVKLKPRDAKPQKTKKKTAWYNFNSNYKSKSEDFKQTFKGVPDDDRLVVGMYM